MTWGFSSYETRFRWAAALWAVLMTVWCMCPLSWQVRLIGAAVWVAITVLSTLHFAWWRPRIARDIPIFLSMDGVAPDPIREEYPKKTVTPEELRILVRNLLAAGYRFQTVHEAVTAPVRKAVVLTFNGGTRDGLGYLLPILKQYGVKATCFVPGDGETASDEFHLKPLELREMARSGLVGFGGTLPPETPADTDPETLTHMIRRNRHWLSGILGRLPTAFAYPNGKYSEPFENALRAAGYTIAFEDAKVMRRIDEAPFRVHRRPIPRGLLPWQAYLLATRGRYRVGSFRVR